jgi:hypothetical protein
VLKQHMCTAPSCTGKEVTLLYFWADSEQAHHLLFMSSVCLLYLMESCIILPIPNPAKPLFCPSCSVPTFHSAYVHAWLVAATDYRWVEEVGSGCLAANRFELYAPRLQCCLSAGDLCVTSSAFLCPVCLPLHAFYTVQKILWILHGLSNGAGWPLMAVLLLPTTCRLPWEEAQWEEAA